jgi:hypothetical protein
MGSISIHRAKADVPEDSSQLFKPLEFQPNGDDDVITSFVLRDQSTHKRDEDDDDDDSCTGFMESISSAKRS